MASQINTSFDNSVFQRGERSPAELWDHDAARRTLDELFKLAKTFNSSKAYLELMTFVARFRLYSPFNAMLIYTQMPGARFVATPRRWLREFYRVLRGSPGHVLFSSATLCMTDCIGLSCSKAPAGGPIPRIG